MKNFKITEQLATTILNYLASQRYADVFQLIAGIQNLQPIEEKPNETTKSLDANPDADNAR